MKRIRDWKFKVGNIRDGFEQYFTEDKEYEVINGKVVVDSPTESDPENKARFDLYEFKTSWGGADYEITEVTIGGVKYVPKED